MAKRTSWELLYGIQKEVTLGAISAFATGAGKMGINTDKFGLLLTNQPNFDSGKTIIDTRKTTGISSRRSGVGYEYQAEKVMPKTSLEMEPGRKALSLFLWLLFQNGASEGAAALYKKTFVPYTSIVGGGAVPEVYVNLIKDYGGGGTAVDHQVITGAICTSMTLAGAEGGAVTLSCDMSGGNQADTFTEGGGYSLTFEEEAPLLFKDLIFALTGVPVSINSFSITITNNAVAKAYNNGSVQAFILKDLIVTGNVSIPWSEAGVQTQIANFMSQTPTYMTLAWGSAGVNEFKITLGTQWTSAPVEAGGDEVIANFAFAGVKNAAYDAIKIENEDSLQRSIS